MTSFTVLLIFPLFLFLCRFIMNYVRGLESASRILTQLVANPCYARNVLWGVLPPPINRGHHLFMQKWKVTVDPLYVDCWSTPPMINSVDHLSINCLYVNCLYVNCQLPLCQSLICSPPKDQQCQWPPHQLPLHWSSIASTLIIDSPPPGSTVLISSLLIINRLYIDHWSSHPPGSTVLIASALIVDCLLVDWPSPLQILTF